MKLGKLTEVDIRSVWAHEQYDFSKWLATEENIQELGNTLGLTLTDIETEKFVGSYRCDIICKDELTGKDVLIENQLEQTNHDHLGKIITYASGLNAGVIVWIVAEARQEHARAIEWLNNNTTDDVAFFLMEVHAYTIGDSEPAPMFKIIEKPNDFLKTTQATVAKGEMSEAQVRRMEFWNQFNEVIEKRGKPFNIHKPSTDHWYTIAVGSSECYMSVDLVNKEHKIRVCLWITKDKSLFDKLYANKETIESTAGETLDWDRLDKRKASLISLSIPGLDFKKRDNYPQLMNTAIDKVISLRRAYTEFINS